MTFKLVLSALAIGCVFASIPACAVDAPQDDADAEEAAASQEDLTAAGAALVGAFHGASTGVPPRFEGLVFRFDGTFFGDVDTGVRCFRAPCPSGDHVEGTYSATKSYLRLNPKAGTATTEYYGRYKYTHVGDKLTLSRTNHGSPWTQSFEKKISYCAAPADCGSQGLIHPMCVGSWTCSETSSNQCGYKCGIVPVTTPKP
jgi:hypothetical protein